MYVKPMHPHHAFESSPSIFDEEAMTALELAGKTAAKMNEVVEAFNALDETTAQKVEQMEDTVDTFLHETAPETIEAEITERIKRGEFDEALAETIRNGMVERETPATLDANLCTENGMFYVRTADGVWQNIPTDQGGVLLCVYGGANTRFYQIFIDYNAGQFFVRTMRSGVFTEWDRLASDKMTVSQKWTATGTVDLNTVTETGFYVLSSTNDYGNGPVVLSDGGLLIVYKDSRGTQVYQTLINRKDNKVYTRNAYNGTFTGWIAPEAGVGGGTTETTEKEEGFYVKKSGSNAKVYQPVKNGYIEFDIGLQRDTNILLDATRLKTIKLCNKSMTPVVTINPVGSDVEGVIWIDGDEDYTCGVHGYEIENTSAKYYAGGSSGNISTLAEGWYNNIVFEMKTEVVYDEESVIFERTKYIIFSGNSVTFATNMKGATGVTSLSLKHKGFRYGMLNAPVSMFTYYLAPQLGSSSHAAVNPVTKELSAAYSQYCKNMVEFYGGELTATVEDLGCDVANTTYRKTLVEKLDSSRLKAYFDYTPTTAVSITPSTQFGWAHRITYK